MKATKPHRNANGDQSATSSPIGTFVGGLPAHCTRDQLTQFMSQFGYVKEVYISKDMASDTHKGFAFVKFASVASPERLFGEHRLNGKVIEIKRSLQDYVCLHGLPITATEAQVQQNLQQMGYTTTEILLGGKVPGVPQGSAGIKLTKHKHQEQLANKGSFDFLGCRVQAVLRIQKKKESQRSGNLFEINTAGRQRSATDVGLMIRLSPARNQVQNQGIMGTDSPLLSCSSSKVDGIEDPDSEVYFAKGYARKTSEALHLTRYNESPSFNNYLPRLGNEFAPGLVNSSFLQSPNLPGVESQDSRLMQQFLRSISSVSSPSSRAGCSSVSYPGVSHTMVVDRSPLLSLVERLDSVSQASEDRISDLHLHKREVLIRFYAFPGHL